MPRPKHIRENEIARAAEIPTIEPGHEDDVVDAAKPLERQTKTLDTQGEVQQTSVPVGEADDPFVPIAKKAGWVELKDWTRDPKDHVDARTYVERLPDALQSERERQRRYSQVAEAAAEEARQAGVREAERRLREAHRSGDEDGVVRAGQELAQSRPHPQTVAWMNDNPWFRTDEDARVIAVRHIQQAERLGASIEAQLKAGEDAVRARFPEHFGRSQTFQEPRNGTTTLAQAAPPRAPEVQGGSRGVTIRASAEKGWADMPSADRRTYEKDFMRPLLRNGVSREDAEKRLAKAYFGVGTQGAPA